MKFDSVRNSVLRSAFEERGKAKEKEGKHVCYQEFALEDESGNFDQEESGKCLSAVLELVENSIPLMNIARRFAFVVYLGTGKNMSHHNFFLLARTFMCILKRACVHSEEDLVIPNDAYEATNDDMFKVTFELHRNLAKIARVCSDASLTESERRATAEGVAYDVTEHVLRYEAMVAKITGNDDVHDSISHMICTWKCCATGMPILRDPLPPLYVPTNVMRKVAFSAMDRVFNLLYERLFWNFYLCLKRELVNFVWHSESSSRHLHEKTT
tara:strand:+ start:47 stop:856 length:810 start_codon:yes stop_codon:yes gene_type:complete